MTADRRPSTTDLGHQPPSCRTVRVGRAAHTQLTLARDLWATWQVVTQVVPLWMRHHDDLSKSNSSPTFASPVGHIPSRKTTPAACSSSFYALVLSRWKFDHFKSDDLYAGCLADPGGAWDSDADSYRMDT